MYLFVNELPRSMTCIYMNFGCGAAITAHTLCASFRRDFPFFLHQSVAPLFEPDFQFVQVIPNAISAHFDVGHSFFSYFVECYETYAHPVCGGLGIYQPIVHLIYLLFVRLVHLSFNIDFILFSMDFRESLSQSSTPTFSATSRADLVKVELVITMALSQS